jgi:hypothetical protein
MIKIKLIEVHHEQLQRKERFTVTFVFVSCQTSSMLKQSPVFDDKGEFLRLEVGNNERDN